jgi:hypothetical protein
MLLAAGLDALVANPLDPYLMEVIRLIYADSYLIT